MPFNQITQLVVHQKQSLPCEFMAGTRAASHYTPCSSLHRQSADLRHCVCQLGGVDVFCVHACSSLFGLLHVRAVCQAHHRPLSTR